ncbi:hypothetical protein BWI93_02275 [Siphonobacter sp. BAB-5385]|uniref:sensor histidine kinase n=1 Tax=Siphonobacter sp. BAB-5385 TaxID=1864822 RepID=UPI000B9DF729|nr:histidine kinase [Siphonobacter sp. BAB-5385]OZI09712.1 hypothetical protein BWI93_02275 [Siphonobacter sp. BAB-5385]
MESSFLSFFRDNKYIKDGSARELIKPGIIFCFLLIYVYALPLRFPHDWQRDPVNLLVSQFFLFLMCCSSWLAILYILHEQSIPQVWQKILASALACLFISIGFHYAFHSLGEIYTARSLESYPLPWALFRLSLRGLMMVSFLLPFAYFYVKRRDVMLAKIQIEQAKNEKLTAQLIVLQQQMTPHFLYNSLQVLGSGNGDDWTKKYIAELNKVVSYQLQDHDQNSLISVADELQFVESYVYILQERFEGALRIAFRVSEQARQAKIPPYALQTLVENAIKHNIMSSGKPLSVEIFDEQDYIVVRNNYQPKVDFENDFQTGSGIGLKNIQERYQLLADRSIVIAQQDNYFTAKAPLLVDSTSSYK